MSEAGCEYKYDPRDVDVFVPEAMVVPVPRILRSDPRLFLEAVESKLRILSVALLHLSCNTSLRYEGESMIWPYRQGFVSMTYKIRYMSLSRYVGEELQFKLSADPALLAKTRKGLISETKSMPSHVGILKVGLLLGEGDEVASYPMMDIVYDTTESDNNTNILATLIFLRVASSVMLLASRNASDYLKYASRYARAASGGAGTLFSGETTPHELDRAKSFANVVDATSPIFELGL